MLRSFYLFITSLFLMLVHTRTAQAQLLNAPAWQKGAPAKVVQSASNYGSTDPMTLAYSSNVKSGNLLVVCSTASSGYQTVSDSSSHTWNLGPQTSAGGADGKCWYTVSTVNSKPTITISNGGGFVVMTILEVAGATLLDRFHFNSGTGATASVTSASPSGESDYFILQWSWDWAAYVTWTSTPGWNSYFVDGNGSGFIAAMQTKWIANSPGDQTATITKTVPANQWGSLIMTFKKKHAPIINAQSAVASQVSGGALSATLPNPVRAGSTILVCSHTEGNISYGDNLNGAYGAMTGTGSITCYRYYYSKAGSLTVTVTGAKTTGIYVAELRGYIDSCGYGILTNGNGASTLTMTSDTIVSPNAYVFAFVGNYWGPPTEWNTFSVDATSASQWTMKAQVGNDGTGKYTAAFFELNQKQGLSGTKTLKVNLGNIMNRMDSAIAFCAQ